MALSGSFSGSILGGNYKLRVDWSATQNVSGNTSKITAVMYLVQASSWSLNIATRSDNSTTINGTKYTWASPAINNGGGKTTKLATVTSGNIAHNADGSKSVTISATFNIEATISGSYQDTITASATVTLNSIPRATQPTISASSVDMGSPVTISMPRASGSFTHDLAYKLGGGNYVSIANGRGTSHTWTVPDLATSLPKATSGQVTIRCITKNGSTTVGTKYAYLTAKVPASVVPTVGTVSLSEATDGLAAQFGAYVQNKSKVKVTISASGAKGSTITAYQTTLLGKTYNGSSWTSGLLTSSGTVTLSTKVKDSRGRWSEAKNTSITVQAYSPPKVQLFNVYRVNAAGEPDEQGTQTAVRHQYSVAPVGNKNTATMAIQYKRTTTSTWTDWLTGTALSANTTVKPTTIFSIDYQYDIRITVTDWFGASATYLAVLPTAHVLMDLKADGTGLAFGKVAEIPGLDVGMQTRLLGGLLHPVLPPDTDLNNVRTPNTYVGANLSTYRYANCPFDSGTFTLTVEGAGEGDQVKQRAQSCAKVGSKAYERYYYSGTWGNWICVSDYAGSLLWEGSYYMTATQTVNLPEPVSRQQSGIVLVFVEYISGASGDSAFHTFFIPKKQVDLHPGKGYTFMLATGKFGYMATKYLYISDTSITGHADNNMTGTGTSGITYTNNRFILRYVIGV